MARTKNVGGGLGDEDPRRQPHLPADPKGKATKKVASKKRKYPNADTARAAAVAKATERAERGGARSGVRIVDQLSLEARATLEQVERHHGVQLGPSWLEDGMWLLMRVSLRGSHSSSHSQQSRLRRESRLRR